MKRKSRKRAYVKPECEVFPLLTEGFICTSITPKVPGSVEEEWGNEEEEDGGELEL